MDKAIVTFTNICDGYGFNGFVVSLLSHPVQQ